MDEPRPSADVSVRPGPPDVPVGGDGTATEGGKLGLPEAIALVVGNIVGTGIFLLPASLAAIGTLSFVVMVVSAIGAIALAVVFGRLGGRIPASGGPYAYAR